MNPDYAIANLQPSELAELQQLERHLASKKGTSIALIAYAPQPQHHSQTSDKEAH